MADAARADRRAIKTIGDALERDRRAARDRLRHARPRPRPGRDRGRPARPGRAIPRVANAAAALALRRPRRPLDRRALRADRARRRRPRLHRHARRDRARAGASSAYIGDGANRWPAVHRLDAARAGRAGGRAAPAGSILHAVAEEGVPTREIAEAIGRAARRAGRRRSRPRDAAEHFGWIGGVLRRRRRRVERADARAARMGADPPGPDRGPRRAAATPSSLHRRTGFRPPCHRVSRASRPSLSLLALVSIAAVRGRAPCPEVPERLVPRTRPQSLGRGRTGRAGAAWSSYGSPSAASPRPRWRPVRGPGVGP